MNATIAFSKLITQTSPALMQPLLQQLQSRIRTEGPISFCDYMATALYHPEYGYYAATSKRVGKDGDFITSVSIGHCFGMILARRLHAYWLESGRAPTFHIIEPAAHDGTLCADILTEIKRLDPTFFQAVHYHLVDATPALIQAQKQKLTGSFPKKFTSHQSLKNFNNLHGAILSNELIDAFPVELIRFKKNQWLQLRVGLNENQELVMIPRKIENAELKTFTQSLGTHFPSGYTTEYNPGIPPFTHDVAQALSSGLFITIDYGHSTEDYYHPDRTTGTLQTYHQHQKAEDPLIAPGEIDITTHIDFTRLITAAEKHGFSHPTLRTQASYLTDHARSWLLDIENPNTPTSPDTPALLRQFQTLTHPAMLGTKFTVLEMTK